MESDPFDGEVPPSWLAADAWERDLRELLDRMDRSVEAVVVEGPNDRAALRAAGVTTTIAECATSAGLPAFCDGISGEPIAILTDYDDHGKRLNGRLRDLLPDRHVEARWRRDLGLLLTQRGHYDIESLTNVVDRRY